VTLLFLEIKLVMKYKVVLMKVMERLLKWTRKECGIGLKKIFKKTMIRNVLPNDNDDYVTKLKSFLLFSFCVFFV
jgi:hypothetical protein